MNAFILALLLGAAPLGVGGDPAARLVWTHSFAGPGDGWINDIVPLGDGRMVAVGFVGRGGEGSDWRALAVRLDEAGTVEATREFGAGGGIDAFWSAAPDGDGLVFAGFTDRIGAGGIDAFVVHAGETTSERSFGGAGYDRFTDLAPAPGGGFVFIGHSQRAGEDKRRLLAVRIGRGGEVAWERIVEGPEAISPLYVEAAADGGFVVAGGIGDDILVMKLGGDGRELWRRAVGTPGTADVNHGLALLPNGNIVVAGYSRSWGAADYDVLAVTLSPSGEVLRRAMFGGAGDDRPSLAKADASGRVWIIGSTTSAGAGGTDALLLRLDPSGSFEPGAVLIGGPGDERGTAVRPLDDGGAVIAGTQAEDAFVARLSAPGFAQANPALARREIP